MTPSDFVTLVRELRELGATSISVSPEGAYTVGFAQPVQVKAVQVPSEISRPIPKAPEPTDPKEARQAFRESVLAMAGGAHG